MQWVEKYNPTNLKEVVGQQEVIKKVLYWFDNWKPGKKALLLYSRTGCGKTSIAYALASQLDYEILELNASDFRDKEHIKNIIGSSSKQASLFKKAKIILIDEVDGISGREDYGGLSEVIRCIKESSHRIILTANDPWNSKFSSLRRGCELVQLNELDILTILNVLKRICINEKINFSEIALKNLADLSKGDLRAAINDLQSIAETKKQISEKDLEILSVREKKESIFNALKLIFKDKNLDKVLNVLNETDLDLDECFLWLDENLPYEYKGYDLERAYEALAKADVFRGRIKRQQHYRFLVYQNALMTAGVALSKNNTNKSFINYNRTQRILKLWIAKQKYLKRKSIAEKIAAKTHTSLKKTVKDALPYFKIIFKNSKNNNLIKELDLNEEEIEWLSR